MISEFGNVIFIAVDCCRGDRIPAVAPWPYQKLPPIAEDFFLNRQLERGILFSRVVCGLPYSAGSYCTLFSGFNGNVHGCNAYMRLPQADIHGIAYGARSRRGFYHPEIVSLPELFKERGYRTIHYATGMPDRLGMFVPARGFDIYEYKPIKKVPGAYNAIEGPKFVFIISDELHDLQAAMHIDPDPTSQTGKKAVTTVEYDECILKASELLEQMFYTMDIGLNDVIIWMTDHGKILDTPYGLSGEVEHGWGMKDDSILMWMGIYHKDLPQKHKVSTLVREVDMLPTITSLLGLRRFRVQGEDLTPLIEGGGDPQREFVAYIETANYVGIYPSPKHPNRWGIRTADWKFTKHAVLGNQLFNLIEDPAEQNNLAYRQRGARWLGGRREFYDITLPQKHPMESVLEKKLDEFRFEARSPKDFYLYLEAAPWYRRLYKRMTFQMVILLYRAVEAPVLLPLEENVTHLRRKVRLRKRIRTLVRKLSGIKDRCTG